jgi:hypothetical protein
MVMVDNAWDWLANLERLWPFKTTRDGVKYVAGATGWGLLWSSLGSSPYFTTMGLWPAPEPQQVWDYVNRLPHLDEALDGAARHDPLLPNRRRVGSIFKEQFPEGKDRIAFSMSVRWLASSDERCFEDVIAAVKEVVTEVPGIPAPVVEQQAILFALSLMSWAYDEAGLQRFLHKGGMQEAGRRTHLALLRAIERAASRELGANRGRTVRPDFVVSLEREREEGRDYSLFDRGFEEVEWRMQLESVAINAPPAQRDALGIYLEAEKTGTSINETAKAHGRDPATVRNNFKALSRKHRRLPK